MKHSTTTHRIDLAPAQRFDPKRGRCAGVGLTLMSYEGRVIGSSRQPLYAAARYLMDHGLAAPSDRIVTYRGDTPSLSGIVAQVARWSVEEADRQGLRLVPFRPIDGTRLGTAAAVQGPRRTAARRRRSYYSSRQLVAAVPNAPSPSKGMDRTRMFGALT